MGKSYSTSGISALMQLSSWRSDDTFQPFDPRINLAASAMALIELTRLGKIVGSTTSDDRFVLQIVDNAIVNNFILDGILFWADSNDTQSAEDMIVNNADIVTTRVETMLIEQNVLLDVEDKGDLIIAGSLQDTLRNSVRSALFNLEDTNYVHEALFQTLMSVYDPNASILFSLLGLSFDENLMHKVFVRRSPWMDLAPETKRTCNQILTALHTVTKDS